MDQNDSPNPTPGHEQTPPWSSPPTSPEPAAAMEITKDDRTMAMLSHLLGLLTSFIGPLVIWLIRKDDGGFVSDQSKEALNFQITVLLASIIAALSLTICIGMVLLPAVYVVDIVLCIIACIEAQKGNLYRYPVCLRLVK